MFVKQKVKKFFILIILIILLFSFPLFAQENETKRNETKRNETDYTENEIGILFRSEVGVYSIKIESELTELAGAGFSSTAEGKGSITYTSLSMGGKFSKALGLYIGWETANGSEIDVEIDGESNGEDAVFETVYKYGALVYLTPNFSISPELRRVAEQKYDSSGYTPSGLGYDAFIKEEADGFGFGLRLAYEWIETEKFKFGIALSLVEDKSKAKLLYKFNDGSKRTFNATSTSNSIGISLITTYF